MAARRPERRPAPAAATASNAPAPASSAAAPLAKKVIAEHKVASAPPEEQQAPLHDEERPTSNDESRAKKRARYTSTSAPPSGTALRKQDPAKAAPLPATLPLEAKRAGATFSASTFGELPLDDYLLKQIQKMGIGQLTPVQQQVRWLM